MTLMRTVSVLALAVLVAGSVTPSFAQRDTRPETDRPRIEVKGDSESDQGSEAEPRLPRSTKGFACDIGTLRDGTAGVQVVNTTGKAVPAGAIVTIYVQPGNVQKTFKVTKDWKPGQTLDVPLKGIALPDDAECAVRVSPPVPTGPETSPEPEDPPEPEAPPALDPPVPDLGGVNEFETGDTGPVGEFRDESIVVAANCEVIAYSQVSINNSGNVPWPEGTHFKVTFPNGQVFEFDAGGFVPEGDYGVPNEVLFPDGEFYPLLPGEWTCQIEMTLPDPNP